MAHLRGPFVLLRRAIRQWGRNPELGRSRRARARPWYRRIPGIVEPLTARELEVPGMLATGQSNQATAGEFVVTLDTVKKHVTHVLGKLGAASRAEAVARARELGLIP